MVRLVALGLAAYCYLQPAFGFADDAAKLVVGTWRLTSWLIQVVGEQQVTEPLGPNPRGRLVITSDGYMSAIIAAANRKPATNNDERAALLNSLLAYTGKYVVEGDKITIKVDISWNELLTGQDQVRFINVEGNKLSIRTAEQVSAVYPGKKVVGTLVWERER